MNLNPISFPAGDSHVVRVTCTQRVAGVTSPLPVTGATAVLTVTDGTRQVLAKECVITDGPAGKLEAVLDPEDTEGIAPGNYRYRVRVTYPGGKPRYTVVRPSAFELTE